MKTASQLCVYVIKIKLCVVGKRNLRSQGAVTLDRLFRTSQIQQQGATVLAGIIEVREKV